MVVTHLASPYQVELFDEVARQKRDGFKVFYLHRSSPQRSWSVPKPLHEHCFLDDDPRAMDQALRSFDTADLAIFNFYTHEGVSELLKCRTTRRLPWCFWGERPGYVNRVLGRIARLWTLRALHRSRLPVWGIGKWAVEAYRQEFGSDHPYVNLPYFSNLTRFQEATPTLPRDALSFIYSGSLTHRKGVDLLAKCFARLAQSNPRVRLRVMGEGPLEGSMRRSLAGCADRVDWLGFVNWEGLAEAYGTAHVIVAPSRYDGWGLVVPEGLASGLPVIGTNRTGAALEFLENHENGWLVNAGNEEALFEAMSQAANLETDCWEIMSRKAKVSVKNHTLENGARQFLEAAAHALSLNPHY